MIEMVQSTIVLLAGGLTEVEERATQKLIFNFACQFAGGFRCDLKFFVGVIVKADVLCYFIFGNAETRRLNCAIVFASLWLLKLYQLVMKSRVEIGGFPYLISFKAEIFEIINALGVDKLHKLTGCTTIGIAQHAFHVVVIVLDRTADKVPLSEKEIEVKTTRKQTQILTSFKHADKQASLVLV